MTREQVCLMTTAQTTSISPFHSHERKEKATILFLSYRNYLKTVALRYVPRHDLADEVLQQVYIELLSQLEQWDFDRNVKALLAVMTQNIARNLWRKEARHQSDNMQKIAEHILKIAESNTETTTDQYTDDLKRLHDCIDQISKKSQTLIRLHYFEGRSASELSEDMKLKINTIYNALFRIKSKLRQCVQVSKQVPAR